MDELNERRVQHMLEPIENYYPDYLDQLRDWLNYCIKVYNKGFYDTIPRGIHLTGLVSTVDELNYRYK